MSNLINLNKARKAKARTENRKKASENIAQFGRTKSQKDLDTARNEKAQRNLDQTKRDR